MPRLTESIKIVWLLLATVGSISAGTAQTDTEVDDLDALLDEVLFSEEEFVDDILQEAYRYNVLYSSVTFNSNTYYYGRENDVDQFNLTPQLSFSSSLGIVAGISGLYFETYEPSWSHTNLSAGYLNYLGRKELFRYYLGYSHTFFSDGYDSLTNSIDAIAGLRNPMRTLGFNLYGYYLFGKGHSYQIIAQAYGNFTVLAHKKFKIKHRPEINFVFGNQLWFSFQRNNQEFIRMEQQYNGLLNTQLSIPFYIVTKSWDFEVGYTINFPTSYNNATSSTPTGLFTISLGYLIDFSR